MLDFDVYDIEWRNMQLVVNNGGDTPLENGHGARAQSAAMSFRARLVAQLTIAGSATYTHAWLTDPVPVLDIHYSGARLPLAPGFNFALLGTYRIRLNSRYRGAFTASDRWLGGRTAGLGTPASARYRLGSFNTVDFDLALFMPHGRVGSAGASVRRAPPWRSIPPRPRSAAAG